MGANATQENVINVTATVISAGATSCCLQGIM